MRDERAVRPNLRLSVVYALRELRAGLRGFYIFLGCIALGVAAIAGVNSVAQAIMKGIAVEGQAILGGDASFVQIQREITPEQLALLQSHGDVAEMITMRAMARLEDGRDQTLVELKAVDGLYPLYGSLVVDGSEVSGDVLGDSIAFGEPLLFERLRLEPGDEIIVGTATFTLAHSIDREPDRVGENFGFGPRLMISQEGLEKTGLIQPGSLLRYHYKVKLSDPSNSGLNALITQAKEAYPNEGWRVRSRTNAAPALAQSIERFSQFLTLVGLTSLIVGGVGVANAARAFLETKRPVIATFKSLGAPGGFIFSLYLIQILMMATMGILAGLILATSMPYLARYALGDLLPVAQGTLFFPKALLPGILYGYLATLIFTIWPLALSRDIKPTELFRASSFSDKVKLPRLGYLLVLAICLVSLVSLAVYFSENRFIAIVFLAGIAVSFLILRVVALVVEFIASKSPRSRNTVLRMAVANIHKPGSLTNSVILSLGLGLALLVALALIDSNLRNQIQNNLPSEAPDFFFVDVQNHEIDTFRDTLKAMAPEGKIIAVPMLRGRVVSLKGIAAEDFKPVAGGEWVLRGDRGLTYAKNVPENSTLSQGEWWPQDYSGPPLVSVAAEEAFELGLEIGDTVTVNVLGRNITAEIASFREVQWETLGINFVFVFSPNTFAGAPHAYLATLTSGMDPQSGFDGKLLRSLASSFPAVTSVRIRDALDTVNSLIQQLSTAIRAAASVALLSSILVLAGALAAGNRERVHDAVVLKTLGATRPVLISTFALEYALLGLATAVFALLAGGVAAWFVIVVIMQFSFVAEPAIAMSTIAIALGFTIVLGLSGTWHVLGQRPAPVLREL